MKIIDLLNMLKENYKLEKSMIDYTIDLIKENRIEDFRALMVSISKSKKFDYISKLQEAIDLNKPIIKLDEIEHKRVYTYADKLFSKVTSVFDEIDYQVGIGQDIDSKQMTNFIYANLDEKDRKVLRLIGDRHRLLFMIRNARTTLQEQIMQKVEDLSVERKKSVLGISMAQKSDSENRILKLVKRSNK